MPILDWIIICDSRIDGSTRLNNKSLLKFEKVIKDIGEKIVRSQRRTTQRRAFSMSRGIIVDEREASRSYLRRNRGENIINSREYMLNHLRSIDEMPRDQELPTNRRPNPSFSGDLESANIEYVSLNRQEVF